MCVCMRVCMHVCVDMLRNSHLYGMCACLYFRELLNHLDGMGVYLYLGNCAETLGWHAFMSVFQGPVLKHLVCMSVFQGTLLKHLEEHVIQSNMTQEDIMLYYTTVSQVTLPALTEKLQLHSINRKPHL